MRHLLASTLLLFLAVPVVQAADLSDVDAILARHYAARGGLVRLRGITSIVSRFTYGEPGHAIPADIANATMAVMRPCYKLVGDPAHRSTVFAEGWDGSSWEFYGDPGIVLRTVGAASAASRHHACLDGPLVDYRAYGSSITLEGSDTVGRRPAYRLRVHMPDGFEEDELIDKTTWMLVAQRKVAKVHAFGEAVASETRYSDFRVVDGVQFPFRDQEVVIGSNQVLNEGVTHAIELNSLHDPAVFSPPAFQRTALQDFLEKLFAERDDAQAAAWSYADFRRAHPATDTNDGVQAIGYQMLKMDEPATAIALLERNAHDYPQSSDAAFGLARAYKTAGRMDEARHALQRALQIEPGNRRAKAMLQDLEKPAAQ